MNNNKILLHFNSLEVKIYISNDNKLKLISCKQIDFKNGFNQKSGLSKNKLKELDDFFETLTEYTNTVNSQSVKLYATGIFQNLEPLAKEMLINYIYINHNLFFNIVEKDLESFYIDNSNSAHTTKDMINGLMIQEFRSVVMCGSFRKYINDISGLIKKLEEKEIKILSPFSTDITIESRNQEFVLFAGEELKNERDSWRIKHGHMRKFIEADAIIVCNPTGYFGEGTIFELGYIAALNNKRIIFIEEPKNFSIQFPYEVGLNFKYD